MPCLCLWPSLKDQNLSQEVCHMVSVAFRGLLSGEEEVSGSWVRPVV